MRWASLVLFLMACSGGETAERPIPVTQPEARPDIRAEAGLTTDQIRYTPQPGEHGEEITIVSTLTAPDDQTLFIVNCNGAIATGLQVPAGDSWKDAWNGIINQCLSEPIILAPGESHDYSTIVRAGTGSWTDGDDSTIPNGTYRLIWRGVLTSFDASSYPFGDPLPEDQRASPPITIE